MQFYWLARLAPRFFPLRKRCTNISRRNERKKKCAEEVEAGRAVSPCISSIDSLSLARCFFPIFFVRFVRLPPLPPPISPHEKLFLNIFYALFVDEDFFSCIISFEIASVLEELAKNSFMEGKERKKIVFQALPPHTTWSYFSAVFFLLSPCLIHVELLSTHKRRSSFAWLYSPLQLDKKNVQSSSKKSIKMEWKEEGKTYYVLAEVANHFYFPLRRLSAEILRRLRLTIFSSFFRGGSLPCESIRLRLYKNTKSIMSLHFEIESSFRPSHHHHHHLCPFRGLFGHEKMNWSGESGEGKKSSPKVIDLPSNVDNLRLCGGHFSCWNFNVISERMIQTVASVAKQSSNHLF